MNSPNNLDVIEGREPVLRDPNAIRVLFRHHPPVTIRVSDWVNLGLKIGKSVVESELQQLTRCESTMGAERIAKRYLTGRVRSSQQVRQYLKRKDIEDDVADNVITDLERSGILNDHRYSEWFVEQHANHMGPRQLEAKLRYRGISKHTAMGAVSHIVNDDIEQQALMTAMEKYLRRRGTPETRAEQVKLMNHLARKGFAATKVRSAVFKLLDNLED